MKTTICAEELGQLEACEEGYGVFYAAHKDAVVSFSEALESNGMDDVLWLLEAIGDQLSEQQTKDLHLLACDYAEGVLHLFEADYPEDKRPRQAIEAKRAWVAGDISGEELEAARAAAWAAAGAELPSAAGEAAWAAARAAARAAAGAAAGAEQKEQLKTLLLSWEK